MDQIVTKSGLFGKICREIIITAMIILTEQGGKITLKLSRVCCTELTKLMIICICLLLSASNSERACDDSICWTLMRRSCESVCWSHCWATSRSRFIPSFCSTSSTFTKSACCSSSACPIKIESIHKNPQSRIKMAMAIHFFCSRECDKVPRKKSTASSWKKLGFEIPRKKRRRRNSKWNYSNHFPSPEEIQNWSSRIKLKNFFKKSLPTSRIANNPISSHQQSESKNLKIYRFFFLLRYF